MYIFSMILLIFFAIVGLCAFISALLDIAYKGNSNAVLMLRNLTPDNAEVRIRRAARICLHHTDIRLICICPKDNPAYDICLMMQKEYPFLEIQSEITV